MKVWQRERKTSKYNTHCYRAEQPFVHQMMNLLEPNNKDPDECMKNDDDIKTIDAMCTPGLALNPNSLYIWDTVDCIAIVGNDHDNDN